MSIKRTFLALCCAAMMLPAAAQWNPGDNAMTKLSQESGIECNGPEMIRKADGSTILVYRTFGYQTNPETQQKDTERQFYLYLQILDPDGNKKWDGNGKLISYKPTDTAMFGHLNVDTLSNGNIIMTFADVRPVDNDNFKELNGEENHTKIKPCKIIVYCYDQEGNSVWSPDGVMMPYHVWDPTSYVTYYAGEQLAISDDKIYLAAHILEQFRQGDHDRYAHYAELACFDANNGTLLKEKHYDAYSWYNFELAAAPEGKAYFVYADENDHYSAQLLGPDCENTWAAPVLVEPYGVVSREASSAIAFPPSDMIPMSDGSVGMIYRAFKPNYSSQCYYNRLYPDGSTLQEHVMLSNLDGSDHSHKIMLDGDTLTIAEVVKFPRADYGEYFLYINRILLNGTRLFDNYDGLWVDVARGEDPEPLSIVKADENYNVVVFMKDYGIETFQAYSYTISPEGKLFQRKQILNNVFIADVTGVNVDNYAHLIFGRDMNGAHGLWMACIDATDYTNSKPITGELPGKFSVGANKQVQFSKADLQYMPARQTYFFAAHQMYVQDELNRWISETDLDFEDLFGWGTGNNPIIVSQDDEDYPTFHDWGKNAIFNSTYEPGTWRTMSKDEWDYLLNGRANAAQKRAIGQITMGEYAPFLGMFLLPDNFEMPGGIEMDMDAQDWEVNAYDGETLLRMEKAGVVFLPAGGFRTGLNIHDIKLHGNQRAYNGYYWTSSTVNDQYDAQMIYISQDGPSFQVRPRSNGLLVRLVRDTEYEPVPEPTEGIKDVVASDKKNNEARKVLINGQLFILRDGRMYNVTGSEVR